MGKFISQFIAFIFCAIFCASCANLKLRKDEGKEPQPQKTILLEGESTPEVAPPEEEPVKTAPRLGVILGPGSVKAFAHTGVLKQLYKNKIKVHAIYGLEWGALVAGLYARNLQINDVEWRLYKLQASNFKDSSMFSSKIPQKTVEVFKPFLDNNFGNSQFSQNKIKFACPSLSIWSGIVVEQQKGSMSKGVSHCLPYPPLFKPSSPWLAASFAVEEGVKFLRKNSVDVILFVNVLGPGQLLETKELMAEYQSAILWQELRNELAEYKNENVIVLNVNTGDYRLYDFTARNSLVLAGERAGSEAVEILTQKHGF